LKIVQMLVFKQNVHLLFPDFFVYSNYAITHFKKDAFLRPRTKKTNALLMPSFIEDPCVRSHPAEKYRFFKIT